MNTIKDILQVLLPVLIIFGPAVGAIMKKVAKAAEKKKAEIERQKRELDSLRTGRAQPSPAPVLVAIPANARVDARDARAARDADVADRRKQQLEELRRRREQRPRTSPPPQGAEIAIGPDGNLILRIPGAPTQSAPQRPAPVPPIRPGFPSPSRRNRDRSGRPRPAGPIPATPYALAKPAPGPQLQDDEVHRLVPEPISDAPARVTAAARAGLPIAALRRLGITNLRAGVILGEIFGPPVSER